MSYAGATKRGVKLKITDDLLSHLDSLATREEPEEEEEIEIDVDAIRDDLEDRERY